MTAVLSATTLAFLLERLLRSLDMLSQTSGGLGFLGQLTVDLAPHYLGLTLPAGFFIALFVVVSRLNRGSEIDAMLAGGVSLSRLAAPLVGLGVLLTLFSLTLYGFVQPYSRYAYHAVLHAAEAAGWNGEVKPRAVLSPSPRLTFTADVADPSGAQLERVFIRRLTDDGREEVITAARAQAIRDLSTATLTMRLRDGQLLSKTPEGDLNLLTFAAFTLQLPLSVEARLLRARGLGEESELTLFELAAQAQPGAQLRTQGRDASGLPRQLLLAELYSRLARALALPLMPLLAIPFGLTAKRAGSAPALAVAAVILFLFQAGMVLGQGMAASGRLPAVLAIGAPAGLFAAISVGTFLASRQRPGENPVNWTAEQLGEVIARFVRMRRRRLAARGVHAASLR